MTPAQAVPPLVAPDVAGELEQGDRVRQERGGSPQGKPLEEPPDLIGDVPVDAQVVRSERQMTPESVG